MSDQKPTEEYFYKELASKNTMLREKYLKIKELEKENERLNLLCSEGAESFEKQIKVLREELAKYKLRWQTGKPPKDGWYWFDYGSGGQMGEYIVEDDQFEIAAGEYWYDRKSCKWAGPIPEPSEPEEE